MDQASQQRSGASLAQSAPPEIQPGERFIRLDGVMELTGLGRTTIYRMKDKGTFPKSVPLPGGRTAWLESEIRSWMQERVAMREDVAS